MSCVYSDLFRVCVPNKHTYFSTVVYFGTFRTKITENGGKLLLNFTANVLTLGCKMGVISTPM